MRRDAKTAECWWTGAVCADALAVGAAAAEPPDGAAAVRRAVQGLIAADNAGDLEAAVAHYAPDAVLLPPSGPPIETREAIEPIYRAMFERYELDLAVTFEEVGIGGDWAWCRGTTTGRMEPRAGAAAEVEPRDVHDKFLMILAPGPDGAWRITTLMWNPVPG